MFNVPNTNFNETVWKFYNDHFADAPKLTKVLYEISDKRGDENEEQQKEIEGLAQMSKVSEVCFRHKLKNTYNTRTHTLTHTH